MVLVAIREAAPCLHFLTFIKKMDYTLKNHRRLLVFSSPPIVVSERSSYACLTHLEASLRIVQSFSLLLCPRSLPRVFEMVFHNKVVEKAIRMFPQFKVSPIEIQQTSWVHDTLLS